MDSLLKCIKAGNLAEFSKEAQRLSKLKVDLKAPLSGGNLHLEGLGWTCLHYAAYYNKGGIVAALISDL